MRFSTFLSVCCMLGSPFLLSCYTSHPPSSIAPGRYSTTTGLSGENLSIQPVPRGVHDYNVIRFKPNRSFCPDAAAPPKLVTTWKSLGVVGPPGIMLIDNSGLGIDEAEVSNLEWKYYQEYSRLAEGINTQLYPLATALPTSDYFTNAFYHRYPVVGISYEQAEGFCRWRSSVITATFNDKSGHPDSLSTDYVRFTFRLPSEAEWEIAAIQSSKFLETNCLQLPISINPAAADYLQQRSGSEVAIEKIEDDIKVYNRSKPRRSWINYNQSEPYFLRLQSPGYVWQGPPNDLAIYQILGNAAEMVAEKGITKGGSYLDPIEACTAKARGTYTGPAPHIGFRCVCIVTYPNRR